MIKQGEASVALRNFSPGYVSNGSDSTVLPTGPKATNVGCSPDSGGTVHRRLFVGQCQYLTSFLNELNAAALTICDASDRCLLVTLSVSPR
jgi:hypothetical protein